ncbi:MAG: Flp family type IVb pilin [Acidimicrobiales bacterium]
MLYLTFLTKTAKERGAGLAEYALLLALIAVLCIGALGALQVGIDTTLRNVAAQL